MSVSILQFHRRRLVIADAPMKALMDLAKRAANTSTPVLLCGESGTGKELIARYIHEQSKRQKGPFVSINCAAVPEGLMESELFGHERGAFTGAIAQRIGKFERASGGTLLLDEVSEMSINLQAKLLRVLQEGEIDRLGGRDPFPTNCRIIATTNRDPKQSIAAGTFREDLFYRLNVLRIECPPLRGRPEAIRHLASEFLIQAAGRQEKEISQISEEAMHLLESHRWSGNIRELQNAIERAVLLCDGPTLEAAQFSKLEEESAHEKTVNEATDLAGVEKNHILGALKNTQGNRTAAADNLGISVRTLRNKLKSYALE